MSSPRMAIVNMVLFIDKLFWFNFMQDFRALHLVNNTGLREENWRAKLIKKSY